MKLSELVIRLAVCWQLTSAFSPVLPTTRSGSISGTWQRVVVPSESSRVFSSQWDEEESDTPLDKATSFEDAGVALQEEEDNEKMVGMGNYDANPSVSRCFSLFLSGLLYFQCWREQNSLDYCSIYHVFI